MTPDVTGRDVLHVEHDGEEKEVYNHVSVSQHHYVNSVNGYESFGASIAKGDMGDGPAPDAVTKRVARLLSDAFAVDIEEQGIEVIDLDAEDVHLL